MSSIESHNQSLHFAHFKLSGHNLFIGVDERWQRVVDHRCRNISFNPFQVVFSLFADHRLFVIALGIGSGLLTHFHAICQIGYLISMAYEVIKLCTKGLVMNLLFALFLFIIAGVKQWCECISATKLIYNLLLHKIDRTSDCY